MNKKVALAFFASTLMVGGAFAHGYRHGWHGGCHHGWGPRPVYHHHYHHDSYWGRGGCNFWPGFVGGVIGGAVASAITAPRETVVVQQTVPTVVTQPVVVQQPPVVVQQPPVVVQQPPVVIQQSPQQVWIEGRYVDQVQSNGSTVRVWQPGHYETR